MIESINLANVACYDAQGASLDKLSTINYIYGANGTGKTTISRVIADEASFRNCLVTWKAGRPLETLVYNQDFVKQNFAPAFTSGGNLQGVFTLGSEDVALQDGIRKCREEIAKQQVKLENLQDQKKQRIEEKARKSREFREECWSIRERHNNDFKWAFGKTGNSKEKFADLVLEEAKKQKEAQTATLEDLQMRRVQLFEEEPVRLPLLQAPNGDKLLGHEANPILGKKILGKSDVDIAGLITHLGNGDWVKRGQYFLERSDGRCPFCQQGVPLSLRGSLEAFFDQAYEADLTGLEKLESNYRRDCQAFLDSLTEILSHKPRYLDIEHFGSELEALKAQVQLNLGQVSEKRKNPSLVVTFQPSLEARAQTVLERIHETNEAINVHNHRFDNQEKEKQRLREDLWSYLLTIVFGKCLESFKQQAETIAKALTGFEQGILATKQRLQVEEQKLQGLEEQVTSVQPTVDKINKLLHTFGFRNFRLATSSKNGYYKIQRLDGTDVGETLSEGEKSFVTFLYFYHLLSGSHSQTGTTSNRVVVFDDPISSLDSDVVFVVSSLVRTIFDRARAPSDSIRQVFVLTHNVYFHKEIAFSRKRKKGTCLNEETFWTVRRGATGTSLELCAFNPVATSYEILWREFKRQKEEKNDSLTLQNTMRRILENYFTIFGGISKDDICEKFEGEELIACQALFSWLNDGSHTITDSVLLHVDQTQINRFILVFEQVFQKLGHGKHYEMMMGREDG